jgi:hypothetical protein
MLEVIPVDPFCNVKKIPGWVALGLRVDAIAIVGESLMR